jgi:MFS family permease
MLAGFATAFATSAPAAIVCLSVTLFGFQFWVGNVQTLASDYFPVGAVGSIAGFAGTAAGLGAVIFTFSTGWVVDHFSYTPILITAAVLAPLATASLFHLSGRVRRIEVSTLPQGAVARVFGLPVGEVASAAGEGQSRIVFQILDSVVPPMEADSDVMKSMAEQLRTAMTEDVISQYLAALQSQTTVQINEAAVRAATGGGDPGSF